jgi:hypothetical protein
VNSLKFGKPLRAAMTTGTPYGFESSHAFNVLTQLSFVKPARNTPLLRASKSGRNTAGKSFVLVAS